MSMEHVENEIANLSILQSEMRERLDRMERLNKFRVINGMDPEEVEDENEDPLKLVYEILDKQQEQIDFIAGMVERMAISVD